MNAVAWIILALVILLLLFAVSRVGVPQWRKYSASINDQEKIDKLWEEMRKEAEKAPVDELMQSFDETLTRQVERTEAIEERIKTAGDYETMFNYGPFEVPTPEVDLSFGYPPAGAKPKEDQRSEKDERQLVLELLANLWHKREKVPRIPKSMVQWEPGSYAVRCNLAQVEKKLGKAPYYFHEEGYFCQECSEAHPLQMMVIPYGEGKQIQSMIADMRAWMTNEDGDMDTSEIIRILTKAQRSFMH